MTARKIVLSTFAAALVAGAAIPAFAAPGQDRPDRMGGPRAAMMQDVMFVRLLKQADANKDGKITKEEIAAYQDKVFSAADANKDGTLTRGEALDYRQAQRDEFRKNNPRPEQAAGKDDQQERRAERRDNDRREHHQARWSERHGAKMGNRVFRMIDEDRDGKITKAEASAASEKLFARMDKNKDNAISIEDLPDRPL